MSGEQWFCFVLFPHHVRGGVSRGWVLLGSLGLARGCSWSQGRHVSEGRCQFQQAGGGVRGRLWALWPRHGRLLPKGAGLPPSGTLLPAFPLLTLSCDQHWGPFAIRDLRALARVCLCPAQLLCVDCTVLGGSAGLPAADAARLEPTREGRQQVFSVGHTLTFFALGLCRVDCPT